MSGELRNCSVFIDDVREASQTYSKGNFGYPLSGGALELDLVEAAYLLEHGRLEIKYNGNQMRFGDFFEYASSHIKEFDLKFLVFRDLRDRGFIVKPESGTFDLCVYPRGMSPSRASPLYMVCAVSERSAPNISVFLDETVQSEDRGKQLLYGVVDEEGDLTYYKMAVLDPVGTVQQESSSRVEGVLISDRIFLFDKASGDALYTSGYYGKFIDGVLQLSLIEGCYLVRNGLLSVHGREGKNCSEADLTALGRKTQDEFDLRLKAYSDLRRRGLVVKTGFKYGTHFRVYEASPDQCHARYLVHAVPASAFALWPEISRTVRLSGGVKKQILFCMVSREAEYLEFKWFRPRDLVHRQCPEPGRCGIPCAYT